ncbi:MAG: STAS domain-containing protein [Actinobacteria bacterium]|nr:STAS domain-containing protein [Actinomycetota bacterium]
MTSVDPPRDISVSADGAVMVSGEIDVVNSPGLGTELSERARASAGALVVDLSEVTFMDSSGLRVLLEADEACRARQHSLVIRNPSPAVRRLLEITGLTTELSIDPAPG